MLSRIVAVALFAALIVCCSDSDGDSFVLEYDAPVPAFDVSLTSGERVSTEALHGKPVILTFWATTCVPCRRELPMLDELAERYAEDDLSIIAINTGESEKDIQSFFDEIDVDLPVVIDENGELVLRYEVLILPMTYFIDRQGVLQYQTVGEPKERQVRHGLDQILGAAGQSSVAADTKGIVS